MAAQNRNTARRRYHTPGVVDGNLARKLDSQELQRQLETSGQLDFDQQYRRRQESRSDQIARRRAEVKSTVRPAQKVSLAAVAGFALAAGMLVCLLLCYVHLNTISGEIVQMKSEISQLEVEQVALLAQYEQAFDLATVKDAAQAAGMSQPSDSQIIYLDLPGQDRAVTYNAPEAGVFSRIAATVSKSVYTVLEYFR